ncbi:Zn-ribbon domain-containing OB-fold protein [Streptomyces sp. NPDC057002]|uniref:Zn-ribbon domain-containing OB-fold protein n=1 Tax=Streptomyces sp. NPDC057002 TaxID=3345992 RepID=UPI00362971E2
MLRPVTDPDGAPFWEYAARGELRVQACAGCGELRFPPRPCCPHCQSFEAEWRPVSGGGRVWSYVVPHPPLLPGYAELAPYNVVVVELDEAPRIRLVGNLVVGPGEPIGSLPVKSIRIGARVRVVFDEGLPRWVLERS